MYFERDEHANQDKYTHLSCQATDIPHYGLPTDVNLNVIVFTTTHLVRVGRTNVDKLWGMRKTK